MIENKQYLKWIRTQPCCNCGNPETEPHHIIGVGMGVMGSKADDIHSVPLCRKCHDWIHSVSGSNVILQTQWLLKTQHKAQSEGML